VVEKKKWISEKDFIDMIAIAQSMPGILAVNIAILTGYKIKKDVGSIVASLASILPSFIIILAIAIFFRHFLDNTYVTKMFKAIRPVVVALIAVPVFTTARTIGLNYKTASIPTAATFLIWYWGVSPVYIILAAGLGGIIHGRIEKKKIQS
jgi:Chromate transport protein ChrA